MKNTNEEKLIRMQNGISAFPSSLEQFNGSFVSDEEYYSGVTIEAKLRSLIEKKLGMKKFDVVIERDFSSYGVTFRYARIETKNASCKWRFLRFTSDCTASYELPSELI